MRCMVEEAFNRSPPWRPWESIPEGSTEGKGLEENIDKRE